MGEKRVDAGRRGRPGVVKTRRGKESRRPFYIALALIALAGTAAIVYVATRPSAGVATVDPALAPGEAEGYLLGDPNAPVQILAGQVSAETGSRRTSCRANSWPTDR